MAGGFAQITAPRREPTHLAATTVAARWTPALRGGTRLCEVDAGSGTPAPGTVSGMPFLLAQGDPTGFSSPLGQVVVLVALATSLVLLLRWWWQQRHR